MAWAVQTAMGSLSLSVYGSSSSSVMGSSILPPPQMKSSDSRTLVISNALKRWERKEVKPNSLPVRKKLHVKLGDTVKVISGSSKGKIGEVASLLSHNGKIIIKDVNLKTKHVKGKQEGEAGQIVQFEAPIHSSNVMLYSKTANVVSRVGHKVLEDGSRARYLLKTGEVIDSPEQWKKVHKEEKKNKS